VLNFLFDGFFVKFLGFHFGDDVAEVVEGRFGDGLLDAVEELAFFLIADDTGTGIGKHGLDFI
jgi:hypothetical protein